MVGLGETREELTEAFEALREVDVDILTIGQYLRPTEQHLPLIRYYHPDEFAEMKVEALALGFKHVESGPLVRSSYHARDQVPGAELKALRRQATIDADGRVVPAARLIGLPVGRLGYPSGDGRQAQPQGPARRAPLPPRRRGHPGDHVVDRPRPGHQAPDPRLLGVPRPDHGPPRAAQELRRLPAAVPLDRAHPVEPDRRRARRLRGRRRGVPQEQRHHDGAALQPDEAEPGRRAGPRPHHRGGGPGHGPGDARVPGEAGPDLLPRPRLPVRAQRDHRGEGDRLARPGRRRRRHRRPRVRDVPGRRLPAAVPAGPPVRPRDHDPHRRGRARSRRSPGSSSCWSPTASATA